MIYRKHWPYLLCARLVGCGAPHTESVQTAHEDVQATCDGALADRIVCELENSMGSTYEIAEGDYGYFGTEACKAALNCGGNNPLTPYGFTLIPPGPGESAHPKELLDFAIPGKSLPSIWRLRSDEAVVVVGTTPPKVRYYGFQPYVFTKQIGPLRFPVAASFGDAVNLGTIARTGDSTSPFDQTMVLVMTADQHVDSTIREIITGIGAGDIVNTLPIPLADDLGIDMGLEDRAAEFGLVLRAALPEDPQALATYYVSHKLRAFRVTPRALRAIEPFAHRPMRTSNTTRRETQYEAGLDRLESLITKRFPVSKCPAEAPLRLDGPACIKEGTYCLYETRDVHYALPLPGFMLESPFDLSPTDSYYLVIGVDHVKTGKATYSSLAVTTIPKGEGVGGPSDEDWQGSARYYAGVDDPSFDDYYAYKFTRECHGEPYCYEVPYPTPTSPGLANGGFAVLPSRDYLEPTTLTRPDGATLLPSRAFTNAPTCVVFDAINTLRELGFPVGAH